MHVLLRGSVVVQQRLVLSYAAIRFAKLAHPWQWLLTKCQPCHQFISLVHLWPPPLLALVIFQVAPPLQRQEQYTSLVE